MPRRLSSRRSKMKRHSSADTSKSFRKRLGIRRSMDLSGEEIEAYHSFKNNSCVEDPADELKASLLMEIMMTAADVAHNLQGWGQMCFWSTLLYQELRKAFVDGRGGDPQGRWFENQIGFLDSYLLPLAHRLERTKVFGPGGLQFAAAVKSNRIKWLQNGAAITEKAIAKGVELFPENQGSTP
jgi:hypothetical protein